MIEKYLQKIQDTYGLTDYQRKQLKYLVLTLLSESSKLLLLAFCFRDRLPAFLFATFLLLLLRSSQGGWHCNTYLSCFLLSFLYYFAALRLLPRLPLPGIAQKVLLLLCLLINCLAGPVTSSKRPRLEPDMIRKSRIRIFAIHCCYLVLTMCIPPSFCMQVGFWVFMLHTLQLLTAKFYRKEVPYETEKLV